MNELPRKLMSTEDVLKMRGIVQHIDTPEQQKLVESANQIIKEATDKALTGVLFSECTLRDDGMPILRAYIQRRESGEFFIFAEKFDIKSQCFFPDLVATEPNRVHAFDTYHKWRVKFPA